MMSIMENNVLHLIFNDGPKNWKRKIETRSDVWGGESPYSTVNGVKKGLDVLCFSIHPDGKNRLERLFEYEKDEVFLNSLWWLQPGDGSLIQQVGNKKEARLVRLRFNE